MLKGFVDAGSADCAWEGRGASCTKDGLTSMCVVVDVDAIRASAKAMHWLNGAAPDARVSEQNFGFRGDMTKALGILSSASEPFICAVKSGVRPSGASIGLVAKLLVCCHCNGSLGIDDT